MVEPQPATPEKIGSSPAKRAADEAALLVAPHFELDAKDVLDPAQRTQAVVEARWVTFTVLHSVYAWNPERISDVTTFTRGAVAHGLGRLAEMTKGTRANKRLKAIVESCLKEAAGGGS